MPQTDDSFAGAMKALNLDMAQPDILQLPHMNYLELAAVKRHIESSLETLFDLLLHEYRFDETLPLVIDGFPRNDVDVVSIRLLRARIIKLRNDHKQVLHHIETQLAEKLAPGSTPENSQTNHPRPVAVPFALVKSVLPSSPSDKAGLRSGDQIVTFDGEINATNHEKLAAVGRRVQERKNKPLSVGLLRKGESVTLTLTPSDNWEGIGLLGCHIAPI